jgi:hypothetical protein
MKVEPMARVDGETLIELFSRRIAESGSAPALFVPDNAASPQAKWSPVI